jgi:hypothetical protein
MFLELFDKDFKPSDQFIELFPVDPLLAVIEAVVKRYSQIYM